MFDAAGEQDEKAGDGEFQHILKKKWSAFQLAETIMSLMPEIVATVRMTASNRLYRLSNEQHIHVCYTSMSKIVA
jgi:hypothetical protein